MASLSRPEASGLLRLGVPEDYAAYLMLPVLTRFAQENPLVDIELTFEPTTGLLERIGAGLLDLALITPPGGPGRIVRELYDLLERDLIRANA